MKIGKIIPSREEELVSQIEVKNGLVLGGITLTGIVAAITSLITLWLIDIPGYSHNRQLYDKIFQMEVLDHCLRVTDSVHRANSIRVLLAAGIIDDGDSKLNGLLEDSFDFPSWHELNKFETSLHKFSMYNGAGGSNGGGNGGSNDSIPTPAEPGAKANVSGL